MSSSKEELDQIHQPFLPKPDSNTPVVKSREDCNCVLSHRENAKQQKKLQKALISGTCHLFLISVYTTLFFWLRNNSSCCVGPRSPESPLINSPLAPLLEYENRMLGSPFRDNPFVGEPGPVVDEAWARLLQNSQIRVSKEEVEQTDHHTSIALADGSGYVAELAVYHWLHCLKWIKQNLDLDYYHPDWNDHARELQKRHIKHCIEFLREAIMCKADVSIITFRWVEEVAVPVTDIWSSHECVKWDTVESWADDRRLNLSEPGLLEPKAHPNPY